MRPAARLSDSHICPQFDGCKPHIGGNIVAAEPLVLIAGLQAARKGDKVVCAAASPIHSISEGAENILIAGSKAARLGDGTSHGGTIITGEPSVLMG